MTELRSSKSIPHTSQLVSAQRELLLQAWKSAFTGRSVTYLSGPITTGFRFVEWYRKIGRPLAHDRERYIASLQAQVTQPNEADLLQTAQRLRRERGEPVLEPASLHVDGWSQEDYIALWVDVVKQLAAKVVTMPGWQFSRGCAAEVERAFSLEVPVETVDGRPISLAQALATLRAAADELRHEDIPILGNIDRAAELLERLNAERRHPIVQSADQHLRKDESLDRLAEWINVAQFVSFLPEPKLAQAYSRVWGFSPNHRFPSPRAALETLLQTSPEHSINLRSYEPYDPRSREFRYGIKSLDEALSVANRLADEGLHVIANETVDVNDGGVSGVLMGDVIEFAPDATPRCVEEVGVCSLPRSWGIPLLATVYGFVPDIDVPRASRLEFSIHPKPRGWRHTHTLGWEYSAIDKTELEPKLDWPNKFSRLLGDKVFGLLVAHAIGLPVPRATVLNRRVAPFTFGRQTGSFEVWLRTSPSEQDPGRFTTSPTWIDPFLLLQREDPGPWLFRRIGRWIWRVVLRQKVKPIEYRIPSVVGQSAVKALYSGAAVLLADGKIKVEGKGGEGETFMRGITLPDRMLPETVQGDVEDLYRRAERKLGPVRLEWVHDGKIAWVVQLHRGATQSTETVLVPGDARKWIDFHLTHYPPEQRLPALRKFISRMQPGTGLVIVGDFGLTSHLADVVRKSKIPARIGGQVKS